MSENANNEEAVETIEEVVIEDKIETVEEVKEEIKPVSEVVSAPVEKEEKPGLGFVADGVMGSTVVPKSVAKKPAAAKASSKKDTVAVYSTRNVTWPNVGKVYTGYNIVTKEASDKWNTRDHIRIATPEEVAREFGL
jgi:hypothetical protein